VLKHFSYKKFCEEEPELCKMEKYNYIKDWDGIPVVNNILTDINGNNYYIVDLFIT